MDRQTLCDWVHRYNAEGLAGLTAARRPRRGGLNAMSANSPKRIRSVAD